MSRGIKLTAGGEPTFNARDYTELPEWNSDALGPTKYPLGVRLMLAAGAARPP